MLQVRLGPRPRRRGMGIYEVSVLKDSQAQKWLLYSELTLFSLASGEQERAMKSQINVCQLYAIFIQIMCICSN